MRTATNGIDYTNKDYEAFRGMMIAKLQDLMPEYTDTRQTDAGIVILELNAMGLDILSFHQDIIANEVYLETAQQRDNVNIWCRMLGYNPKGATPAKFKQVFVLSSVQTTDTTIAKGTIVKTSGSSIETIKEFETEEDLVIPAGKLGNEKDTSDNYLYTVTVVQGTSVNNEILGTSDETENQSFTLVYYPVILDSISVSINEGDGLTTWTKVDNFMDSGMYDRHYTVSTDNEGRATITFGDGTFGKIPKKVANSIYCSYRIGGGDSGNVGANKITNMGTNLALVTSTFNPASAFETGEDAETLDKIKINAPIYSRTRWGALTTEDFSDVVTENFPFVVQAVAKRDTTNIDNIHIYVLLKNNETLTEETKAEIMAIFDENEGGRKIVGIGEIYLESPTFVPITFTATLVVKDGYVQSDVEQAITDYITDYLAIGNYPFDTDLSLSQLISNIMDDVSDGGIAGIKALDFTSPTEAILTPEVNEIYSLGSITYTTTGGVTNG